jgi:hypothetical protein
MLRWCTEVTSATGVPWSYAKVPYKLFHGKHFGRFGDLLKALAGQSGQLVLPLADAASAAADDPPADPPASVVEHFWKTFGSRVPANGIVLASLTELDSGNFRNAIGVPVSCGGPPAKGFLFFVDLDPEANWAHACAYVFVASTGETAWCPAEWPPEESTKLKLQARP